MIKKEKSSVVILLIVTTIIATTGGALLSNLPQYYRLSKYGVETQGTVVSKQRENHKYIEVEYKVNDRLLKSGGHAEDINKDFESVQLNEKVTVYYNPLSPDIATLGNPNKYLRSSFVETCFVAAIPILFLLSYVIKKRLT